MKTGIKKCLQKNPQGTHFSADTRKVAANKARSSGGRMTKRNMLAPIMRQKVATDRRAHSLC